MQRLPLKLFILILLIAFVSCRGTPLINAILKDDKEQVRILLSSGENVNEPSPDNFSPLHWAVYYGKTEIVKILLEKGANVNLKSERYGTPLTLAAQYGFTDVARLLLEKGADVNAADYTGKTALGYAQAGNYREIVRMIQARGAARLESEPAASAPQDIPEEEEPRVAIAQEEPPVAITQEQPRVAIARERPRVAIAAEPQEVDEEKPIRAPRDIAGTPLRMAVFNFESVSLDASRYGAEVTQKLINTLKSSGAFYILGRRELEEFLSINDLQQNDNLDNIVNIGSRLGLDYIITGRVDKKGTVITIDCYVVNLEKKKAVFSRQARSVGEAGLTTEVKKLSDALIEVMSKQN